MRLALLAQGSWSVPHAAFRVHDITASRHFYKDFSRLRRTIRLQRPGGKLIMAFININDRQ